MNLFFKESKSKRKNFFCGGGEGAGECLEELIFFYKESKSKKKKISYVF